MTDLHTTRRTFLRGTLAGTALTGLSRPLPAEEQRTVRQDRLKIVSVQTFHVRHQLSKSIGPSTAYYNSRETILVKITSDTGLTGWGETAPLTGVRATIDELGKTLVHVVNLLESPFWSPARSSGATR